MNVPAGQYLSAKVINLGTNRWAYKPELGLTVPFGNRWLFDTYFGVWLFSDNDDYLEDACTGSADDDAGAPQLQLVAPRLGGV